jgi:hypothetical protein
MARVLLTSAIIIWSSHFTFHVKYVNKWKYIVFMPNFFRTLRQTASTYGRLEHWVKNPVYPLDVRVCGGPTAQKEGSRNVMRTFLFKQFPCDFAIFHNLDNNIFFYNGHYTKSFTIPRVTKKWLLSIKYPQYGTMYVYQAVSVHHNSVHILWYINILCTINTFHSNNYILFWR